MLKSKFFCPIGYNILNNSKMIVFEDDDTESQMSFGKTRDNLFYFEIGDKDESSYSSLVKLNSQEAQILAESLVEFIKNDK